MVRPRVILPEIARQHGRSVAAVRAWRQDPAWPASTGKRGRWLEYDADAVDQAVREITGRRKLTGKPGELLTVQQIADETGLSPATIRADISRGRWPGPDNTDHGVNRWTRRTVSTVMAGRRGYRKSDGRNA